MALPQSLFNSLARLTQPIITELTPESRIMEDSDRRRFLELTGLSALATLSGCASAVRQADGGSSGDDQSTNTSMTRTATPVGEGGAGTQTASTESPPGDATAQAAETATPVTIQEPTFGLSAAPIPERTTTTSYATMGDADATLTIYGSWKCPYTREFVRNQLGSLVETFVVPGDVSVRYRSVAYEDGEPSLGPDAPRATRAGLAVWDIDPSAYWSYFAYVFENQPPEAEPWAQTDTLVEFAERAGVRGRDQIRRAIESNAYERSVQATVDRAEAVGVDTYPRVVYDGRITAPTRNPEQTYAQFERAADDR